MSKYSIGFDIGGTHLRAALFDQQTLLNHQDKPAIQPIAEARRVIGTKRDVRDITSLVFDEVKRFENRVSQTNIPVGVGIAGMVRSHDGQVLHSPHLGWKNAAFGRELRNALAPRACIVENDVNSIVVGEHRFGAGQSARSVLAVFFGTGVGSALVVDNKLFRSQGASLEIGHTKIVVGQDARLCACGLRGCVEAYVGGKRLQQRIHSDQERGEKSIAFELAASTETQVHPGHLDQAASQGDSYALKIYEEIAPLAGAALANAITLFNPERLIIGGGMMTHTPILQEMTIQAFEVAVNPSSRINLDICQATLGDRAGTLGSALLAIQ